MRILAVVTLLALTSCDFLSLDVPPPQVTTTIILTVSGTVTGAGGAGPLAGATVRLGNGGALGQAAFAILDSTTTNASGQYSISKSFSFQGAANCSPFVQGSATNYTTSATSAAEYRMNCAGGSQTKDIVLQP